MQVKNFIIVWQNVPESTYVYRFDTEDEEWIDAVRLCHGRFGGSSGLTEEQEEALTKLSEKVTTLATLYSEGSVTPIAINSGDFEIIITGWFM